MRSLTSQVRGELVRWGRGGGATEGRWVVWADRVARRAISLLGCDGRLRGR